MANTTLAGGSYEQRRSYTPFPPGTWPDEAFRIDGPGSALSDTTDDPYHTFLGNLLDHLNNTDMLPGSKMRTSPIACENRSPKHLLYGRDMCRKAINTEQQPATQSAAAHLLYEMCYELSISMSTHYAAQPKTSGHLKRHCQPGYTTLMFHSTL